MDMTVFIGILEFVIGGFCVVLWSNYTSLKSETQRNASAITLGAEKAAKEVAEHRLHTAETYTTKGDLSKAFDAVNRTLESMAVSFAARFDRLDSKLDSKADKEQK